ncbi:MAG: phosphatidylglycerophosphatase A [Planctomycetes bacterium]|nr:phosphatidylglycerophosphatase A [Planctomycetota bacterium]
MSAQKLLGTFFGIGLLPGPAGTYASAATAAILLPAHWLGAPWWGVAAAAAAACALSLYAGRNAEQVFGSKDPRPFVLDEVAGMLIAGLAAWTPWATWTPWAAWTAPLVALAIAFLWFRVTDVVKPPPVRQLERLPGAWGILMDDVAAGLLSFGLGAASLAILGRLIG